MTPIDHVEPEPARALGAGSDTLTHAEETELALEVERLIALRLHAGRGRRHAAALVLQLLRGLS